MMNQRMGMILSASCVAICGLAGSTRAEIVDLDAYTLDTRTGFLYLDLTSSTNRSFTAVNAELGIGGDFEGHRRATLDEVTGLFSSAGAADTPFAYYSQAEVTPQRLDALDQLIDAVGVTNQPLGFGFERRISNGFVSTFETVFFNQPYTPFVESIDYDDPAITDRGSAAAGTLPTNVAYAEIGHWLIRTGTGTTPGDAYLPTSSGSGTFSFTGAYGDGAWFDPVAAFGYSYEALGGANFLTVGLPPFDVVPDADMSYLVSDAINGDLIVAAGDFYTFPTPVSEFTITGIDPGLDPNDPLAFSTFLKFDQTTVSFNMTPLLDNGGGGAVIPEPRTFVLSALGLLVLGCCTRMRRRRSSRTADFAPRNPAG